MNRQLVGLWLYMKLYITALNIYYNSICILNELYIVISLKKWFSKIQMDFKCKIKSKFN